jgi:hypothetical protein
MCTATAFKSHTCPHKWLTITLPCGPGMGFDTCARHTYTGQTSLCGGPRFIPAPAHSCPTCNKKDQYDGNKTRMVLKDQTQFGTGYWYGGAGGGYGPNGGYGTNGFGYGGGYAGRVPVVCCVVM